MTSSDPVEIGRMTLGWSWATPQEMAVWILSTREDGEQFVQTTTSMFDRVAHM